MALRDIITVPDARLKQVSTPVETVDDALRALMFGPRAHASAILAEVAPEEPPVGIALYYYTISTFSARPGLFLEDIFVEPGHRGQGLGIALFRELGRIAQAENCVSIVSVPTRACRHLGDSQISESVIHGEPS